MLNRRERPSQAKVRPTRTTHFRILDHSDAIVLAVDDETSRVVGYITAITDHVITAFIPQFEVLPEFQGQGIAQPFERMLKRLCDLYAIDLLCDVDADVEAFYAGLGFQKSGGMCVRNYENQAGAGIDGIAAGTDAAIAVTLVDDQCPWNNGVWTFSGEGGVLSIREGGDPACHLTIQGLSALVWSGIDPATFPFRGWGDPGPAAQATLRALFPRAFPVLNEKF